jgi:hypothetical protein
MKTTKRWHKHNSSILKPAEKSAGFFLSSIAFRNKQEYNLTNRLVKFKEEPWLKEKITPKRKYWRQQNKSSQR